LLRVPDPSPDLAEPIAHFGGLLAGYAALVAAVFATVKGTQEWAEWQRRKRHDKMAEVAGQAIVTGTKFANALHGIALFMVLQGDPEREPDESYGDHQLKVLRSRIDRYREVVRDYEQAWLLAEAYLPDVPLRHVRELWDLFVEIQKGWRQFALGVASGPSTGDLAIKAQQRVEEAMSSIDVKLDALRVELRKHTIGGNS
jgi:hypothetical protein